MTEQLTIKDLNCSTCQHYQYKIVETEGEYCLIADEFIDNSTDHMEKVGCASHPLALQVLAGPVITELEHMRGGFYVGVRGEGFIHGISTAINLLKEGVH